MRTTSRSISRRLDATSQPMKPSPITATAPVFAGERALQGDGVGEGADDDHARVPWGAPGIRRGSTPVAMISPS